MIFHGVIVYEIVDNGNILKGIYTNTHLGYSHQIMNEVVKSTSVEGDCLLGTYSCSFMEKRQKTLRGELEIQKKNEVYELLWKIEGRDKSLLDTFKGVGLKAGNGHLAVSYWYL